MRAEDHKGVRFAIPAILFLSTFCAGCSSVYDTATEYLPPDVQQRLSQRIDQARETAGAALIDIADARSQRRLDTGAAKLAEVGDRAESASWELKRRVASIDDVMRRIAAPREEESRLLASFNAAAASLSDSVDRLGAAPNADLDLSLARTRSALSEAILQADAYLVQYPAPESSVR